jgi:drug/metabolite transporter (DMT)-like permease
MPAEIRGPRGLAWMILAQGFFAGMNVCTRLGSSSVHWAEIAAVRFLVGGIIAVGLAGLRGTSLRVTDRPGTWRRSVFGTLAAIGAFYALSSDRIAVGDAATLSATAPIFVALLAGPMLGERVGPVLGLAVLLAFAGVLAVVRPAFSAALPVAGVATVGAFCYALAMIWLRRIGPAESHEAVVLHFSLVGLATMTLLALPHWRWPDWRGGLLLLGAGVGGGGAQLAMTRAYSLQRAAPVTALSNLGIVFTHLLAIPLFAERPGAGQYAGAVLVIAATGLVAGGSRHPGAA